MKKITVTLDDETAETLSTIAQQEHRTIENLIEFLAINKAKNETKAMPPMGPSPILPETSVVLIYKNIVAQGVLLPGKRLKVFKGSHARLLATEAFKRSSSSYKNIREELVANHTLVQGGDKYIFDMDYIFDSPSAAATVICGRSSDGQTMWCRVDDNRPIGLLR